jgi:hypothetical protein
MKRPRRGLGPRDLPDSPVMVDFQDGPEPTTEFIVPVGKWSDEPLRHWSHFRQRLQLTPGRRRDRPLGRS